MVTDPLWRTVRRVAGRNDFGFPEDEMIDVVIPFRLPEGKRYVVIETGEVIDSDGKIIPQKAETDA